MKILKNYCIVYTCFFVLQFKNSYAHLHRPKTDRLFVRNLKKHSNQFLKHSTQNNKYEPFPSETFLAVDIMAVYFEA